jgi:hypothetical protein
MLQIARTRSLTTEEFERVCGTMLTESRFAALGNALMLTTRGSQSASVASFSQHVLNRRDGIDPDWQVEVFADRSRLLPLLKPGLNAIECRSVAWARPGPETGFVELLSRVQGAVSAIEHRSNSRPDCYTLITNLRLGPPQASSRRLVERNLLLGHDRSHPVALQLLGAEELTELVNRAPYIRSVFFEDTGFGLWQDAWRSHTRPGLFGNHVELVGREAELAQLKFLLKDSQTRVITISGPAHVGKTRLALEATAAAQYETVVVSGDQLESVSALHRLATPGKRVIAIVDNCGTEKAAQITRTMVEPNGIKSLVLLAPGARLAATFGYPPKTVSHIVVTPLANMESHALLNHAVSNLDHETENWIAREADGNPGILLAAARLRLLLHRRAPSLQDALVQGMKQRVREEFGEHGYQMLRVLSLMTRFDMRRDDADEVGQICRILDCHLQPSAILRAVPRFREAGVVNQVGRYLEVVPSILAEELTLDALRNHPEQAGSLVNAFGNSGRLRIAGRPESLPALEDNIEPLRQSPRSMPLPQFQHP